MPLVAWYKVASKARWQHLMDVRRDYPSADGVGELTIFNVGGNDFRLAVRIDYARQLIYVLSVGTHGE